MSRGRNTLEPTGQPAPFSTWVLTVDDYNRLRLPADVELVVPWLGRGRDRVQGVASAGPAGGMRVAPQGSLESRVRPIEAALRAKGPQPHEPGSAWIAVARYAAMSWPLSVHVESSRFTLTLPEKARKLRLVPGKKETAVVFAVGAILEIWTAEDWLIHIRSSARLLDELYEAALEELEGRGGDPP